LCEHTNGAVLILAPLAVSGQTIAEGEKFGIRFRNIQTRSAPGFTSPIMSRSRISTVQLFAGVVLDESSILKNFEGKTKQAIIDGFADTRRSSWHAPRRPARMM
jgi:hypothetical protein